MQNPRSPPSMPDRQQRTEANNSLTKENDTMAKIFEIRLRHGHPTNVYRRDGIEFRGRFIQIYVPDPVRLTEEQLTEGLRNDPWLAITPVSEGGAPQEPPTPLLPEGGEPDEKKTTT